VRALRRFDCPRFGLRRAKHQARDAGVDHGAHAHLAGFDRHVQRRPRQPVIPDALRGVPDSHNLGVGGRVVRPNRLVAARPRDLPVDDDHRANWHFAPAVGLPGGMERRTHEPLVGVGGHAWINLRLGLLTSTVGRRPPHP
jgi:hypothetical protein